MREILFRGFHPCDGPDTIVVDGEKVKGRWVEGYLWSNRTIYYGKHNIYDEPVVWENDIENDSFGEPYTSGYCIHGGNWEITGTVFDEVNHE